MDSSLLLVNIFAGAFVGYVTKLLAINMLFQKYPIVGGAEIIKERESLGESISKLVEERLIKPETLMNEFQKDGFKNSFENLISHVVKDGIGEHIKDIETIAEIEGIEKTSDNLYQFLLKNREKILDILIINLLDNVLIEDLLSKEQLEVLINNISKTISVSLFESVDSSFDILVKDLLEKNLDDLISNDLKKEFLSGLLNYDLDKALNEKLESEINHLLLNSYKNLFLDDMIVKVENNLKDKTLNDILGDNNSSHNLNAIKNRLLNFINSEKGQIILKELIIQLIAIFKTIDVPLANFINDTLEENLSNILGKHLEDLLIKVEVWIKENKKEVENLINSAIEEHLGSEGLLKQVTGAIFAQKLAERYKIVEGVLEELDKTAKNQSPELLKLLRRLLENTNVSDIVKLLSKSLIDVDALIPLLINLLNNYLPKIELSDFDFILDKKINQLEFLKDLNLSTIFEKILFPEIIDKLKDKILFNPNTYNIIREELKKSPNLSLNIKLNDLITLKSKENIKSIVFDTLNEDNFKKDVISKLSITLPELIKEKHLNSLMSENIRKHLYDKSENLYSTKVKLLIDVIKQEKTSNIHKNMDIVYSQLSNDKTFSKQITSTLINLMNKLIKDNGLLNGKIYIAVKESFTRFTDDELKDEMNSFMGKELQPIKLLGAFLGAGVGIAMYYISFIPNYGYYTKGYWALLSYPFAYAVTEVGTNWMAIKMLFKPYNKKMIPVLNVDMPFTPGIFPKNKKALAESMVNFIDKKLLSTENMIEILERYHHKWKQVIKENLSKNNYESVNQTINSYVIENYDNISPLILDLSFKEINKNKLEIAQYISSEVKNVNFKSLDTDFLKKEALIKLDETKPYLKSFIVSNILTILESDKKLSDITPEKLVSTIKSLLPEIQIYLTKNFISSLNKESFIQDCYHKLLIASKHNIQYALSNTSEEDIKKYIHSYISNKLKDKQLQNTILDFIENKIVNQLTGNKKISELFGGKIVSTIEKESDTILESLSNYIIHLAKNKKEDLIKFISKDIEKKGVLESVIIKFGGLKKDLRGIVDILLDKKLEIYLNDKKYEIKELFDSYLFDKLNELTLNEIGLDEKILDQKNIRNMISNNVFSNEKLSIITSDLVNIVLEELLKEVTFEEILLALNIDSYEDFNNKFGEEKDIIIKHFSDNLLNEDFQKDISIFIDNIFDKLILESKLPNTKIDENLISKTIESFLDVLYSSKGFKLLKEDVSDYTLNQFIPNIKDSIDYKILDRDLSKVIDNITSQETDRSQNFKDKIALNSKNITLEFTEVLNDNLEKETKKVIEDIFVNSLVLSLRVNNRKVLEPIKFDNIVREEVYKMDAQRIESMFDFAKPIFRLLVWYGALAGIIGLGVGIFEAFR